MSYKVKNPYGKSQIMDLNLMGVQDYKKMKVSSAEIAFMLAPIPVIAITALAFIIPELTFFAECQNIPGGDVCSISLQ